MIGSNEPHSPTAKTNNTPPAVPEGSFDVREASIASLTRLREVWAALGCAYNPNDFHISVQQTMWTQALAMIREATEQTSRVYRENQQLEEALRVARTSPSSPPAVPGGNIDVREALAGVISGAVWSPGFGARVADAILADTRFEVRPRGVVPAEQISDPNTLPDDVADAARIEHYEFAFGQDAEPLTRRQLGIFRQAWKCAIAVAIDKMNERP